MKVGRGKKQKAMPVFPTSCHDDVPRLIAARQSPRIMATGLEAELQSLTDKVGRGDPAKKHVFRMARALSFLQHVEACCTGAAQLGN